MNQSNGSRFTHSLLKESVEAKNKYKTFQDPIPIEENLQDQESVDGSLPHNQRLRDSVSDNKMKKDHLEDPEQRQQQKKLQARSQIQRAQAEEIIQ